MCCLQGNVGVKKEKDWLLKERWLKHGDVREKKNRNSVRVKQNTGAVYNQNSRIRLSENRREFPNTAASPDTTPIVTPSSGWDHGEGRSCDGERLMWVCTWEQTWYFQSFRHQIHQKLWLTGSAWEPSCPCRLCQLKKGEEVYFTVQCAL